MRDRQKRILDILNERRDWVTGKELSRILEVSDRTIRSDIGLINGKCGGLIEASVRYGYHLKEDAGELETIDKNNNPQSLEERCNFILKKLFSSKRVSLLDLQSEIFYSEFTLKNDIKQIQKLLEEYGDVSIVENGSVISLQGSEESKRLLYKNMLINETKGDFININKIAQLFPNFDLIKIRDVLDEVLDEYNYKIRSETYTMLMIHIGVIVQRMIDFNYIGDIDYQKEGIENTVEYDIAHELFNRITKFIKCEIRENETILLAKLLMGRQHNKFVNDLGMLNDAATLLGSIIIEIRHTYDIDFSNDEFFKDGLLLHIEHLLKRLKYNETISNVYLHDIKKRYPLVFEVSVFVGKIIEEFSNAPMTEDEIGFIAIHLGAAYDRLNAHHHRYHVVLIQPNNQLMTSICSQKITNRFGDRIQIDDVLRFYEENAIKRLKPDFIITTTNISHSLDIPTLMVSMFFNDKDEYSMFRLINELDHKRQVLEFDGRVRTLIKEEFFFKDLECERYEDVIEYLCDELYKENRVDKSFKKSTFEREKMAWTSLSNGYAIPHPLNYSTLKSSIAIATLKKPVKWGKYNVKLVMLLAIKKEDKDILRIFFDWFSNVCDDPLFLSKMVGANNAEELLELMKK